MFGKKIIVHYVKQGR